TVPIVILFNKQDLWDRKDLENGKDGKAEKIRKYLNVWLPELKDCRIFNASAKEGWGVKTAVKHRVHNKLGE
ncbi:unnamed protein product, partial [marine sediment metagenome]